MRWRREIVEYFRTGLINGRTEGFNNNAKVVRNYRLRLLNACV
jgi:transposase